jgi:chromosome segregation ATPase
MAKLSTSPRFLTILRHPEQALWTTPDVSTGFPVGCDAMTSAHIESTLTRQALDIEYTRKRVSLMDGKLDLLASTQHRHTGSLGTIEGQLNQHTDQLRAIEDSVAEHGVRLDQLDHRLGLVQADIAELKARLGSVETRLENVETRLENVENRLDGMQATLEMLVDMVRQIADRPR